MLSINLFQISSSHSHLGLRRGWGLISVRFSFSRGAPPWKQKIDDVGVFMPHPRTAGAISLHIPLGVYHKIIEKLFKQVSRFTTISFLNCGKLQTPFKIKKIRKRES